MAPGFHLWTVWKVAHTGLPFSASQTRAASTRLWALPSPGPCGGGGGGCVSGTTMPAILMAATRWQWSLRQHEPCAKAPLPGLVARNVGAQGARFFPWGADALWQSTCLRISPWDSPGKNTAVGCHFLPQRILPTQGLNLSLPHCR